MLKTNNGFHHLFCLQHPWLVVVLVLVFWWVSASTLIGRVGAQTGDIFTQLSTLQVGQPFPPGLENQAESVDKRGQKQIYYFRSSNYVYPHFVETDGGHIIHIAVFVDATRTAEYAQKLTQAGKPEVVLQNTENELVLGFPSKGVVFVVNAQKQPVVYERLKPISEKVAIQTYSSDAVIAAVEEDEQTQAQQQMLLKYPSAVIKLAVSFYTAVLANPQMAMIVIAVLVAIAVLFQVVRSVQTNLKKQREAEIASLMQETLAINKQREIAAVVAQTVSVPHQSAKAEANTPRSGAQPAFDVTAIEPAAFRPSDTSLAYLASHVGNQSGQVTTYSTEGVTGEATAAPNPYQAPDPELWRQKAQYNPNLAADLQRVVGEQAVPMTTDADMENVRVLAERQSTSTLPITSQPVATVSPQSPTSKELVASQQTTSSEQPADQSPFTEKPIETIHGS